MGRRRWRVELQHAGRRARRRLRWRAATTCKNALAAHGRALAAGCAAGDIVRAASRPSQPVKGRSQVKRSCATAARAR
jgi:UDP-N-acetylmuramyl tripeptide synthase